MKKLTKWVGLSLLWAGVLFICMACEKEEDYNAKTYYDVIGEGYVFMCDSAENILYPVQCAKILVSAFLGDRIWSLAEQEVLTTDEIGKYCVRFVKRALRRDATRYRIYIVNYSGGTYTEFTIPVDEIKNAKHTILLDTIKTRNGYFY